MLVEIAYDDDVGPVGRGVWQIRGWSRRAGPLSFVAEGRGFGVNLILMPIVASLFGVSLFAISALIGGAMLFGQATADRGKRILIYSLYSLSFGLTCCWIGFALMLGLWSLERHSVQFGNVILSLAVAIFWVSGPAGIVLGVIMARRFLRGNR
jgi:hypothetical protein